MYYKSIWVAGFQEFCKSFAVRSKRGLTGSPGELTVVELGFSRILEVLVAASAVQRISDQSCDVTVDPRHISEMRVSAMLLVFAIASRIGRIARCYSLTPSFPSLFAEDRLER